MSINLFYHKLKTKSLVLRGFLFLMQILTVKILTKKNPKLFLVKGFSNYLAEKEGFEPSVQFPVRMFSKHVLSATQAPLQL